MIRTYGKEHAPDVMSAEELKARLQQHFAKSGTLNNLKTQLRNELVSELFKVAELPTNKLENEYSDAEAKKTLLPLQVSNWLVYDHLKRHGYDYSLSTFVTEASISFPEKLLSLKDILDLLGLKKDSEESERITKHYVHCAEGSFLHSFLLCAMKQHTVHHVPDLKHDRCAKHNGISTNENILVKPAEFFVSSHETEQQKFGLHSKILSNISQQDGMEMYQCRICQEMQSEKKEQENEIHKLRQKLLDELDRLYEHEQQVRLELETRKSRLIREQDLLELEKNKLRAKELDLAKYSSPLYAKTEPKRLFEEENLSSLIKVKEEQLAKLEEKLKQQEEKLSEGKLSLCSQTRQIEDLKSQLQHSEENLHAIQSKYATVLAENTLLKGKVENVEECSNVRAELQNYVKETERCKFQINEIKEKAEGEKNALLQTVHDLQEQLEAYLQKGTKQKDVGIATEPSDFSNDSAWNQQKDNRLEQELGETKQLYNEVLQKLEKQNEDIQDLHITVHILHSELLESTNQVKHLAEVQDKKLYQYSPTNAASADVKSSQVRRTSSPAVQKPNSFSHNAHYPLLYYPSPSGQRTFRDDPLRFISEAKKRISDLEQDAQMVKKKYSNFVASQAKLPKPDHFASTFHDYNLMPSLNYDPVNHHDHIPPAFIQRNFTSSRFDPLPSQIGDPYVKTSSINTAYNKTMHHHLFADFHPKELSESSPNSTKAIVPTDAEHLSQTNPLQKVNTCNSNEIPNLKAHVQTVSSHVSPISSDNALGKLVNPVPNDPKYFTQFFYGNENQSVPFSTSVTVSSTAPSSLNSSKFVSSGNPFHLSKFGLHSAPDKTSSSQLKMSNNQVLSDVGVNKELNLFATEVGGVESNCEDHKASVVSALNDNNTNYLNYATNTQGQNLMDLSSKSYSQSKGESSTQPALQNVFRHTVSQTEKPPQTAAANDSLDHTEPTRYAALSEQVQSDSGSEVTSHTMYLKENETVGANEVVKEMEGHPMVPSPNKNLEKTLEDMVEEAIGTKPDSSVALRRISIDLDSAWKQKSTDTSPFVKSVMRSRSGSNRSLPSKIDNNETIASAPLKLDEETHLKYNDNVKENSSSPGSPMHFQTQSLTGSSPDEIMNVKSHDEDEVAQKSETVGSSPEIISGGNSNVGAGIVSNCATTVDLDDALRTEGKKSCASIEAEKQADIISDSSVVHHAVDESEVHGDSVAESDHATVSSENAKPLSHIALEDNETINSQFKNPDAPQESAVREGLSSVANIKTDADELNTGFVNSNHTENAKLDSEARGLSITPSPDKIDELHIVDKTSENRSSEKQSAGEGSATDEGASELSELNFSAGNDELEQSKDEESDW